MSVIVACRTADGAIVMGAERRVTSMDENREMTKLTIHPFTGGKALIGMAASDVNLAFERKFALIRALRSLGSDEDPIERVRSRLMQECSEAPSAVQLLCAITWGTLTIPRLIGITETEVTDLGDAPFCGVGSGDGAAISLLKQLKGHETSLRDVQIAVCASVWMGKQTDPLCGGQTDVWWLGPALSTGKVPEREIQDWDAYFASTLAVLLRKWISGAPGSL